MATTIRFRGSGPGPQSLDGCSVELWKLLPAGVEPSLIASAVPPRGSILELGAGVGRITHPLLELGYRVTAVDNCSEMLAEIREATTVLANIEDLALSTLFDTVVLASFLVHAVVSKFSNNLVTPLSGSRSSMFRRVARGDGLRRQLLGWSWGRSTGFRDLDGCALRDSGPCIQRRHGVAMPAR
jgi:SAM-dependent methyltransferase